MPGYLKVNVSAFGGILPVRNAYVRIVTDSGQTIKSILTDEDGNTVRIDLPSGMCTIDDKNNVSARYSVSVQADGYAACPQRDVLIYENIVSLMYFELIPEEMI